MNTAAILEHYGVDPAATLGAGMEARVYARDDDTVLKLYHGTVALENILVLQRWYDALDATQLPYALPRILGVADHDGTVATIERRLHGTPMTRVLPRATPAAMDQAMRQYVHAALALQVVRVEPPLGRYKLFDPWGISATSDGDWHGFLRRWLRRKSAPLGAVLRRDVRDWDAKLARLRGWFDVPYTGPCRVIHGDFFPGNLLLDTEHRIAALLDFGLMTMVGDPLWDVATGAAFFDMYDEWKVAARERCLGIALDRLGVGVRPTLNAYVLVYSIVGADAYDPACADGHYRWCVANLDDAALWRDMP
jgi:aminoglycoside phosphotransferase (APT) family kinase protein